MLLLAAQHADIVALSMPPFAPVANVAERISWLRAAAGSRFTRLELNINLMAVGDRVATWIAHRMGLSANDLAQSATALLGTVDQMCETLRRRRESLGISYIVVGEEFMDVLAPVVEQLAGH
jgi:hypothetical protein